MKILVIGGVAAGTKAAAKLKRLNRDDEVTIITKGKDISYAGCGLPYYVGGLIESRDELIVNTPAKYSGLTGVNVVTETEVTEVDFNAKTLTAINENSGESSIFPYDKLIIASGASPIIPLFEGRSLNGVFTMRTPDDAVNLRNYISADKCVNAVVVGGGFIGLEIAENLKEQGLRVSVIDVAAQVMPNVFDREMAGYVKKHLADQGINVFTGTRVESIVGREGKVTGVNTQTFTMPADVVVLSIGIEPNTTFLGRELKTDKGLIVVNDKMETNIPDVYAVGDCALVSNRLTGKAQWSAMGSTANYTGRMLAQVINGLDKSYKGCLGTGVLKLPKLNCGRTGLTESAARSEGYDVITATVVTDDKAHYYPGAGTFITKLIADKSTHKLLGMQVLGAGAVDKMVDIAVTGISMGARIEDFGNMDFAYAPPFSTAIHPFVQACYVLENKMSGEFTTFTPAEYLDGKAEGYKVLDVQPEPKIAGAKWINPAKVNGPIEGIGKDEKLLLVCARGKRGYFLQNRLKHFGYTNTAVLEGGVFVNDVKVTGVTSAISPEDVKRVKALGCFQDKRYPDIFNVRIITRNGKISFAEQMAIAEAANKYGSGEVTMTSRLTLEIQGVPYANIEDVRNYVAQVGLETGGSGSKIRPVVSCKGTTCQYGLIDTFELSEEIHERFYHGYNDVNLPHKFKIAVGGCPNNCVKPNLNDLGVMGRRIPEVDLDKCRGCKVCFVEKNCPTKVAKVVDGKVYINPDECNQCGRCVNKCTFKCITNYTNGYKVYVGGRWGKKVANGRLLDKIFTSKEEVLDVIEKAILLFRDEGEKGERFSDTINRLGFEYVQEKLLSNDLLENKKKILDAKKNIAGGATC